MSAAAAAQDLFRPSTSPVERWVKGKFGLESLIGYLIAMDAKRESDWWTCGEELLCV
jgi:hypothetical protein